MEGWRGVHKPLLLQALTHFPDFALATGAPHPPSWLLGPPCSLSAAGLPSCLRVVGDCRWWSRLPERAGEIWSQPHCRAWGPISTNLLPLPVEVHNILDIHTGMGGSLQGGLHGPREHTGVVQMQACDDGHHATRVLLPCPLGQS